MADISNSKLLETDTGILSRDACIVVVRTEWNAQIVDRLEEGCLKTLRAHQVESIKVVNVPGAVEIPFAVQKYWDLHKYKDDRPLAFIALGCVLRGGTPHFDYVCRSVTDGITQLNLALPVPVIFGVLTVDNQQQAEERVGGAHGHKGNEAAITALKMIQVVQSMSAVKSCKP